MKPVFLHGWPDGSVDTTPLAGHLCSLGLDLVEIGVSSGEEMDLTDYVKEYATQVPHGEETIFIGYCSAAAYAMHLANELTRQGRPPAALLLVESTSFSGTTFLLHGFDKETNAPPSVQLRYQLKMLLPPYNQRVVPTLSEWLRVRLAPRRRFRRLLDRSGDDTYARHAWIHVAYVRALFSKTAADVTQPVVSYQVKQRHPWGPAGSMGNRFLGPVAVRTFEGADHHSIMADPHAINLARAIAADYRALEAGSPLALATTFLVSGDQAQ